MHLRRRFILISVKQQSSLQLTFSSSFFPVVIPQIRQGWHPKQQAEHLAVTHYGIRLQLRLSRSARWSEEWEARQTHAFGLSSEPTVRCCHVGKLSLGAAPGESAHCFAAVGDTYHDVLPAGQSSLLACVAHLPWGGTTNLTGFQPWSLCAQRYQRTWVMLKNGSITSSLLNLFLLERNYSKSTLKLGFSPVQKCSSHHVMTCSCSIRILYSDLQSDLTVLTTPCINSHQQTW